MQWDEVELDQSCPGNHGVKFWISDCDTFAKKGNFVEGEWTEVMYKMGV